MNVLERECLEISKQLLREFTSAFCAAPFPREIRDMVYRELIPENSPIGTYPMTGLPSNWIPLGLRSKRFDLWNVDLMGEQFICGYAQTLYETGHFQFWDSMIKRLPSFLKTDPFDMGLRPGDLVRRIKLLIHCKYAYTELIGGHIHDGVETVSGSWEAIEDILPQLSGLVTKLCHITLTIGGPVLANELYQQPTFWKIQLLPGLKMLAPVLWGLWTLGHPIRVLFGREEFIFQSDILYSQYRNKLIEWATV
ncbi:hypothetical protein N0V83_007706 [Neocucurbitaria cava]|uniref:Uncharacterized protein n=1 Tax=Neocucurbitaria cava TaxID=798079 RepID=A0A9W9CKG2_9PLEO|nr:hypothetical protein N0V83_007706 [Neocucurbitaria cava]